MRFQVTQVMDAIEQRLTTDLAGAQAVVDLGEVVRRVDLDGGRPVNLVRVGMVVDALSRYLVDGGAMLYGVAERSLLSEGAFTSKERMVLSRWADDGLIEIVGQAGDRAAEVADLTGLPLIAVGPVPARWPDGGAGRVLRLTPRSGTAVLTPLPEPDPPEAGGTRAVGRAAVKLRDVPANGAARAGAPKPAEPKPAEPKPADAKPAEPKPAEPKSTEAKSTEAESAEPESGAGSGDRSRDQAADGQAADGAKPAAGAGEATAREAADPKAPAATRDRDAAREPSVPLPVAVFAGRGSTSDARVRISRYRLIRATPNPARAPVLARQWRCDSMDCAAFGEARQIGQPVPALRGDTPVCPRHDRPLADAGPRPAAYPVSIVVDDLPRRRLVVREGAPVTIGRTENDPDVFSVAPWLHRAAAAWISGSHVKLEAGPDGLRVTDLSARGTMVWRREGPDARRRAEPLHRGTCPLGEWDSLELYTGIEVVRGDYRLATVLGPQQPESVLIDAPTAAHRTVGGADQPDPVGDAAPAGSRAPSRSR